MRPLVIVKTGSTVPSLVGRRGDFEDWFRAGLGLDPAAAPVVDPREETVLPDPAGLAGVVVTGSAAMVTDAADWSLRTEAWLRAVLEVGTPLLAVCYGHQLLARAAGGSAGFNPRGREIGTVEVALSPAARDDPLLGGLPDPLRVQATHSQSVLELPPGARLLAGNAHDPHQAFFLEPAAWGMQFHPEFDADVIRGYLHERRGEVEGDGIDVDACLAGLADGPEGTEILRRFAALARAPGREAPRSP